jgi:hypothetical protein
MRAFFVCPCEFTLCAGFDGFRHDGITVVVIEDV